MGATRRGFDVARLREGVVKQQWSQPPIERKVETGGNEERQALWKRRGMRSETLLQKRHGGVGFLPGDQGRIKTSGGPKPRDIRGP